MRRILALLTLLLAAGAAQARLSIEITGGMEGALPIAVVPFQWQGPGPTPEAVGGIVAADLRRSGAFAPLAEDKLPARPHQGQEVKFQRWRGAGVENLVVGRLTRVAQGQYEVRFQLFDVLSGEQLTGYSIKAQAGNLRRVAHQISDIVYEELTGKRGAFDTHIAYVTVVQGKDGKRRYKLAVADADGYNEQIILTSKQPLLSPAWSPDGKQLAYVSFESGRTQVFVQSVATGKRRMVADFKGINGAPSWSPDGKRLALVSSRAGNPEIYVMELESGEMTRITRHYGIDTEPDWAPDGGSLLFTSDRGGRPQIYRVNVGRSGAQGRPERLTFEGTYNARGSFSPDGKRITMVHGDGGR
ncbi:MAG TPA: Tol-Pal system beta propeller repeat protein TolB, partial [Gammaproteobacteria bacterium]|nr:Tol-Pal system beta propeller repeat protein TolB [Gammaproteobacteria bacterium]